MGVAPLPLLASLLASSVLVLAGCGDDSEGRSAGDPVTSEQTADEVSTEDGSLFADPGAIRPFPDPAAEISSDGDLVDYLLPGLTGSGADCVEDEIDVEAVLGGEVSASAGLAAELVLSCVAREEVGKVFGMYAVGFEEDGRSRYADLAVCVADGFAEVDRSEVAGALTKVYVERLDLAGPPTSRLAAAEEIARLTECSTSGTPTPETSGTTPSETPTPKETDRPRNQRVIRWDLLQPGDCLVNLPPGRIVQVTVVSCDVRHRLEVVGATFTGGTGGARSKCENLYANYTGRKLEESRHALEYLESEPGSLSVRLVCLATRADGRPTTGSLR